MKNEHKIQLRLGASLAMLSALTLGGCGSTAAPDGETVGVGGSSSVATGGDSALGTGGDTGGAVMGSGAVGTGAMASGGAATGGTETGGMNTGGSTGGLPAPTTTSVTLEENGIGLCAVDGVTESTHAGFTGAGYLNGENSVGAGIEWAVQVGEAGSYTLEFAYANEPATDRPGDVLVGDAVVSSGLSFPSTTSWATWSIATVEVQLAEGENRIALQASDAAGLANIDSLTVSGPSVAAFDCAGMTGTGGMGTGGMGTGGMGTGGDGTGGSGPRTTFRNPLNQDFGPDPWMTYYDGYYYLAATTWDKNHLSMKRGRTIQELKDATPEVIWQPGPAAASRAMWAPEFFLLDNGSGQMRWYFYFTAGDGSADFVGQRSHVLESSGLDPMGPYTYKAQLLNYWAIDGSILEHGGNLYFMFSAWDGPTQNNYIQRMTNPWTLTGNRTRITMPEHAWEKEGTAQVNEGAEPLYHDGRTFVTYSASQCGSPGYKLGLLELTGSDPMNPAHWWKSPTPVFQAANGQYGTGHNGFFMSPDGTEYWIAYHGVTNPNGSCWIDRTTRIQPFGWDENGLPDFGEPLSLNTDILAPSGE